MNVFLFYTTRKLQIKMTFEDELELEKQLKIDHSLFIDLLHCLDDINIHGYSDGIQGLSCHYY